MSMPDNPGNCPIIATPFTRDGAVDYESLEREIRRIAQNGCEAATMFGIASEFYKLTDDERERIVDVVTNTADDVGLSPVLSVTHESTDVAVQWAVDYEAAGADCIMVFPPRRDPTVKEVLDHIRQIGEAVDVPVMVQHTPENVAIPPMQFAELHEEVPNIRYFKIELDPPGPYISDLIEATDGSVTALVGNWGYKMIDGYDRGAVGVMPISLYDELYVEIHNRYLDGDRQGAVELHDELLSFLNDVQGIASAKRLLADRGIIETGYCRPPTGEIEDEVTERRLTEAHEHILEVVEPL